MSDELAEFQLRFKNHIEHSKVYEKKVDQLVEMQADLIESVKVQSKEMERLNDGIDTLSKSIDNGFAIMTTGAKLFRTVIYSFLGVIMLLGSVIVYITQVDIDISSGKFGRNLLSSKENDEMNKRMTVLEELLKAQLEAAKATEKPKAK